MSGEPPKTPAKGNERMHRLRKEAGRFSRSLHRGRRGQVVTAVFLALTLLVIASVIIANWETLVTYEWQIRPLWLLYAFLFLALDLFLGAYAWHRLVARFTPHRDLPHNLRTWAYANLARRLPGPIWYMASRALLYEEKGISKVTTSLLSGLELVFILMAGIVTFLLALPFWGLPAFLGDRLAQSWLLLLLAGVGALLVHPRVLDVIWRRLGRERPLHRLRWRDTLAWLLFYVGVWLIGGCVLFSIINFLQPLPWREFMPVVGMWALANTISLAGTLTLSGMGLREISLTLLLTQFVPAPVALIIAIFVRIIWLMGELGGALLSITL